MIYQREPIDDALCNEVAPLVFSSVHELGTGEIAINGQQLQILERIGLMRCFTVRTDERSLAGYALFMVSPHLHRPESIEAKADAVYLHPEHRNGWTGVKLLRYAEDSLAKEGVSVVYHSVLPEKPALGRILEREGYRLTETVYEKRLAQHDPRPS